MTLDLDQPVVLRGVCRDFGRVRALDDVNLSVPAGGTVGLLGPNGSGKTTLLSLVSGLREPSSGSVALFGGSPRDPAMRVRLGVTPQQSGVVKTMTVAQMARFITAQFVDHETPSDLLGLFGIEHLASKRIGALSGGQQRLVSVALAFAGRPRLVLLDEPSTGLDIEVRNHLWRAIQTRSAAGVTILLTSHYLEEVQALSDRIVMLQAGRVVADDTTEAIVSHSAATIVRVTTGDDRALGLPCVLAARRDGPVIELSVRDAGTATKALASAGIDYTDIDIHKPTLEDAFTQLTQKEPA